MNLYLNRRDIKYLCLILCLFGLFSAESLVNDQSLRFLSDENEPKLRSLINEIDSNINGRTGYNTLLDTFAQGECYVPSTYQYGQVNSDIVASSSVNRQKVIDTLSIGGGLNLTFAKATIGAHFKFENEFKEDSLSTSFYYYAKYQRIKTIKYSILPSKLLTEEANELLNYSIKEKKDIFLLQCGNNIITSVTEGGFVVVQVKVSFDSSLKKNNFDGGFNIGIGSLANANLDIKKINEKLGISGKVNIKIRQVGGDSALSMKAFPDDTSSKCADAMNPNNTNSNISECTSFLSTISDYLRNSFSTQFTEDPSRYSTYSFAKKEYSGLEIPVQNTLLYAKLRKMKEKIMKFSQVNNYYLNGVSRFLDEYPFALELDKNFKDTLKFYQSILRNNSNFESNDFGDFRFTDCWEQINYCTEEKFNLYYTRFNTQVFAQVDALLDQMKNVYDYNLNINDCAIALSNGNVRIRIFPTGANSFRAQYVSGNLNSKLQVLSSWTFRNVKVDYFTDFEFQIVDHMKVEITRADKTSTLKVNVKCSVWKSVQTGSLAENPFYFQPQQIVILN